MKNLAPLPRRRPHWERKTGEDCRGAAAGAGCSCQRGSSIRSPQPEWSRVSRVTCHEAAAPIVRHNSCLDAQQSLERSEGSEEGGSRASSGSCQPSPAQPAQPSPAQPSPAPHLDQEPETWTREAVVAATAALHQ